MMSLALVEQINTIVEQMPEKNQALILELVKTMVPSDDLLSERDITDIEQARAEFAKGEFVKHEEINWN